MKPSSSSEERLTLRQRFRSATREAILEAAAAVFSAGGAAPRMEDIAAEAGIAVGTVYNYFADRTALMSALLETRTRALLEALDAAPAGAAATAAARAPAAAFQIELEHFVTALAGHLDANRALFSALLDEERHHGIDARAATRRRTLLEQLLRRAEQLIASGMSSGALRKGDPAVYAALLVGMVRGMATSALTRDDARFADGIGDLVRLFLHGAAR